MKSQDLFEIDEKDYSPELAAAMDEYMLEREQESPQDRVVTADQLPEDLKEALGLDMFPEDIQNDILALSQKIMDYAVDLVQEMEQESPYGGLQTRATQLAVKHINCLRSEPSSQILREAWKVGTRVNRAAKLVPNPTIKKLAGPVAFVAHAGGAAAGQYAGCMLGKSPFKGPMTAAMRR